MKGYLRMKKLILAATVGLLCFSNTTCRGIFPADRPRNCGELVYHRKCESERRTLQSGVQGQLLVPNSAATLRRRRIVESSRSGWSPLRGHSCHSVPCEHVWLAANLGGKASALVEDSGKVNEMSVAKAVAME